MDEPRYVLHPGIVFSRTDGDVHHVGARRLADLYGVNPRRAEVYDEHARYPDNAIHLYPDDSGRYKLPKENR